MRKYNPYEAPEHEENCDGTYDAFDMCSCDYADEDAYDRAVQSKIDQISR